MTTTKTNQPYVQKASHLKRPPGPSPLHMVQNTLDFQRDPLAFLTRLTRDYGDLCQIQLLIGKVIVINHPDYVRHMLVEHPVGYDKHAPFWDVVRLVVGNGLGTAEEQVWRRQRRLLQPAFHKQQQISLSQVMIDQILSWLKSWEAKVSQTEPINMAKEMQQLTLFLLSQTIFSSLDLNEQVADACVAISEVVSFLGQYFRMPFPPLFVPTKKNHHFKQDIHCLDRIISSLIERRRSLGEPGSDLLGLLLAARDEESGERMSDQQLRDELITFFAGGTETTAAGLTWIWYLLSEQTEVRERLYEEVDRVLADHMPIASDLPKLVYTRMIIEEGLRLYPPVPLLMRRNLEEEEMGGHRIPKHSLLLWSPYLLHRHPEFWEDPERFRPERFSPEQAKQRHPQAYGPFGAGPHLCIGQHFALMEMALILALVASRYYLRLVPGQVIQPVFQMSLVPRDGLPMYMRTRDQRMNEGTR